jgi:hypothetical protein
MWSKNFEYVGTVVTETNFIKKGKELLFQGMLFQVETVFSKTLNINL